MKAQTVDLTGFQQLPSSWVPIADFAGDLDIRWQHMNGVLEEILKSYKDAQVLDIAAGGGHDTIFLRRRGYDVTPNEVEASVLAHLKENLQAADEHPTAVLNIDWRDFLTSPQLTDEAYDVVFSLGNAFPTYLFTEAERIKALQGLWRVLKPGGTLFFDTRNYDYILSHAAEILRDPEHNFPYLYRTTYINRSIVAFPEEISPKKFRLRYKNTTKKIATYIEACPITIEDVQHVIKETLGDVEVKIYYDYQTTKPERFDFVQYVIRKPLKKD